MKKIFLFAAAVLMALNINAKTYEFVGITLDDIDAGELTITEEEKDKDGVPTKTGRWVIAIPGGEKVYEISLYEDIKLHYASDKSDPVYLAIDPKNGYFEFPGNGKGEGRCVIIVEGATVDENVTFELASKGSSDSQISAKDDAEGESVVLPKKDSSKKGQDPYDKDGYYWVSATFKANASTMSVTAPGSRVRKIVVGGGEQGIGDLKTSRKAIKRFENGQLIIIKNGVKYNAIGVKL